MIRKKEKITDSIAAAKTNANKENRHIFLLKVRFYIKRLYRKGGYFIMGGRFEKFADFYRPLRFRYRRPTLLLVGTFLGVVLVASLLMRPTYRASTLMTIKSAEIQDEWDLLKEETREVDFEEQILSRKVLEGALRNLGLFPRKPRVFFGFQVKPFTPRVEQAELGRAVKKFRKTLHVERLRHSAIIRIAAKAKSPKEAADRANAIARSFVRYRRESAIKTADHLIRALDEELASVRRSLREQTALQQGFLSKNGWDDYENERRFTQERIMAIKHRLRAIEMVQGDSGAVLVLSLTDASSLASEPAIRELTVQLAAADARLTRALSRYKEVNPFVAQARRERNVLEETFVRKFKERQNLLHAQLLREEGRFQLLVAEGPKARTIEATITQAERHYQELLNEQAQARLKVTLWKQSPDAFESFEILDRALPPPAHSIWINVLISMLAAGVLGGVGLMAIPFMFYYWESKGRVQKAERRGPADRAFIDVRKEESGTGRLDDPITEEPALESYLS